MRTYCVVAVVLSLVWGVALVDVHAQDPPRRFGRRLGEVLRGQPRSTDTTPAPAGTNAAARPPGPLREGLRNLGVKAQEAIQDGTLESMLAPAGNPSALVPSAGGPSPAGFAGQSTHLKPILPMATRPFTPSWFAAHPQAWQYQHPESDAWAGASFATTAHWLGIQAAPPLSLENGEDVFTNDTVSQAQAIMPVRVPGDEMPLGVFALGPAGSISPSALVQLAVNKAGEIHGNYYDVITGEDRPLSGVLDKQTQLASFGFSGGDASEFEASLVSLTRATGSLRVRHEGGNSSDWSLARFEPAGAAPPITPPAPAGVLPPNVLPPTPSN